LCHITQGGQGKYGAHFFVVQNCQWFCTMKMPALHAFATLCEVTQIDTILFVSYRPRWPRQVRQAFLWCKTSDSFAIKMPIYTNLTGFGQLKENNDNWQGTNTLAYFVQYQ